MSSPAGSQSRLETLVVEIHNTHSAECGTPPRIVKQLGDGVYVGYFQNRYGEQWVVEISRETKTGVLRGGDVGWEASHLIQDDKLEADLILSHEEAAWLINCWRAATGGRLLVTTIPATDDLLGLRRGGE